MPRSKPPAPRSKPPARPSKPPAPRPAPPADGPPNRESLEAFAERAKNSLGALPEGRDEARATRDAERDEVARALKLALKSAPELKPQFNRVTKALKEARQREDEVEARVAKLVKAGLAELAELTGRHLR